MGTGWVPEGASASGRVGGRSLDMDGMCDFCDWMFGVGVGIIDVVG